MNKSKLVLPVIIISQFFCTSLWFAGNGVISNIIENNNLLNNSIGYLTSSVQLGFIIGTLIFAIFTIVDRFSPSKVFFISAVFGSLFNLGLLINNQNLISLLLFRFLTGFFLAGIYPVGMKIATDYFEKGLGKSLSLLVGALVLGTALPHLLKDIFLSLSWKSVIISTSFLSILGGGFILVFVKDGPYRKQSKSMNFKTFFNVFNNVEFKKSAFGYFGHMWELYTFWTFIPFLLNIYESKKNLEDINVSLITFIVIASGSIGCILGGYISEIKGIKKSATMFLFFSCICCLISPFIFYLNIYLFISFLIFWGMVVVADSPLFSTLVANNAPKKDKGTALTIVNCVGFSITIVSILFFSSIQDLISSELIFMFLAIGPIIGLINLFTKPKSI